MEQVDAGDEIEGVGERSLDDLGADRPLAQHDRGRVAVKSVGDEQPVVDVVDGDRRQTIPRVGVALDREIVEAIAEIEVRVEDQVVERYLANLHRSGSFVVSAGARVRSCLESKLCRPRIGSRITPACVNLHGLARSRKGVDDHADCRDRSQRPTGLIPDRSTEREGLTKSSPGAVGRSRCAVNSRSSRWI